jgi:hypothetical protein
MFLSECWPLKHLINYNKHVTQQRKQAIQFIGQRNSHISEAPTPRIAKHGILQKLRRVHARAMSTLTLTNPCAVPSAAVVR